MALGSGSARARVALLAATLAAAFAAPRADALTITGIGPVHVTRFAFGGGYGSHRPAAEVPPWITGSPATTGQRGYNVTTAYTYRCEEPAALFAVSSLDCSDRADVRLRSSDQIHFAASPPRSSAVGDLKRNYSGVFSAGLAGRAGARYLLYIKHAENKNEFLGTYPATGRLWNDTIDTALRPADPGAECAAGIPSWAGTTEPTPDIAASGNRASGYLECWGAYNGIVSASRVPFKRSNGWGGAMPRELGPIVWPSAGYIDEGGRKTSFGVRHPSSIVSGGYLYVYYLDTSDGGSVRVARAPTAALGRPASWRSWTGSCWCLRSTPPGLTGRNYRRFWATPLTAQGRGVPAAVLPGAPARETVRFAVARYDRRRFAGVEEFATPDKVCHVALRTSADLVHWSGRSEDVYAHPCGGESSFDYPIFLDASGWSNTRIDLGGFYVLGAHAGRVFSRRLTAVP
jgi:hypothetical protein